MPVPSPRNAPEASRLIRCTEAAAALDVMLYNVAGGIELESFKTDAQGNRTSRRYLVDMVEFTCSCPDFQAKGQFCKHLIFVEGLMREAEEIECDRRARFMEDQEEGRLVMENHRTERSLSC